ncbi:alpha-actinin, putative [Entamoeba invadens IP1]|uniref:Alpha-actinin, putative n=1 Tax=Entamoeba invadens IP1 TaxID=370355 RepID=A0A0A1TYR3_ENTIV|nr:alpha-actinin, putative [Entamoeba invadens IP1]ELP83671.1 alpha-actinin, putative [Entamoeba invadens IP1]|eukprot:XP_004183017.1 alpha-actinin, putative [Entamoeba invadens IP1]
MSKVQGLLQWCQCATKGYEGVNVTNFTTSWKDGKAFCALFHYYHPEVIDFEKTKTQDSHQNLEMAFAAGDKLGVPRMMDVEDFDVDVPDKLSVVTCIGVIQPYIDSQAPPTTDEQPQKSPSPQNKQYQLYSSQGAPKRRATVASAAEAIRKAKTVMTCEACNKPIIGSAPLEIKGKKYHTHCFNCKKCGKRLEEKSFVTIDMSNYCLECGKIVFFENKKRKAALLASASPTASSPKPEKPEEVESPKPKPELTTPEPIVSDVKEEVSAVKSANEVPKDKPVVQEKQIQHEKEAEKSPKLSPLFKTPSPTLNTQVVEAPLKSPSPKVVPEKSVSPKVTEKQQETVVSPGRIPSPKVEALKANFQSKSPVNKILGVSAPLMEKAKEVSQPKETWKQKSERLAREKQEKEKQEQLARDEKMKKLFGSKASVGSKPQGQVVVPMNGTSPRSSLQNLGTTGQPKPIEMNQEKRKSFDVSEKSKGTTTVLPTPINEKSNKEEKLNAKTINLAKKLNGATTIKNVVENITATYSPSKSPNNFIDVEGDWVPHNVERKAQAPIPQQKILGDAEEQKQTNVIKIDMPKPILATWQFYVGMLSVIVAAMAVGYVLFKN